MPQPVGAPSVQLPANDPVNPEDQNLAVDQTTIQIAQMLDLDITGAANADAGTKIVVDALYDLLQQYQECVQQQNELQQQVDEQQQQQEEEQQQQVDENGNPIQPDAQDDPNNPAIPDETDPMQPPQGQQSPSGNKPKFGQQQTSGQKPPAKKPNPFAKKKPAIAASHQTLKLAAENRQMKIDALASDGIITGEVATQLKKQFVTNSALSLSLSNDDDQFDSFVGLLKRNGPVIDYNERTTPQANTRELVLSHTMKRRSNVLVDDAESRNKKD